MSFKETAPQFQMIDVSMIAPNPASPRRHADEASLKSLAKSIQQRGLIHPLVVQPADAAGRHVLIVGERRWRAAVMAGEKTVPALVRPCEPAELLEIQVSENMGLGLRAPLEPRDMANALQAIAERFDTREAAAEHLGGTPTWLKQATAAATANLSPKITALLDAGKIASTGAAIQLEKLAKKNEAKAESLLSQVAQLPEGEKLAKRTVERVLSEEGGRRRKKDESPASQGLPAADTMPWEEAAPARSKINPGKVKQVADILGLTDGDEEEILARLIDEFLALKGEGNGL